MLTDISISFDWGVEVSYFVQAMIDGSTFQLSTTVSEISEFKHILSYFRVPRSISFLLKKKQTNYSLTTTRLDRDATLFIKKRIELLHNVDYT